jgi:branched-chain amino acid aminotransferase
MVGQGMSNSSNKIWFDGQLVPSTEAQIPVLTHALHYGSAVFEGEQVYAGRVFKLAEHTQRLIDSATLLGMVVPYSATELEQATKDVVATNGVENGYVRPLAWRGTETIAVSAPNSSISVMIAAWDTVPPYSSEAKARGIRMLTSKWVRPPPNVAPTAAKASGLYVTSTLAKHAAEAAGYDDALMLDYRGQVAEATLANIFLVIHGELHTPLADCFLNGITRQTVISLATEYGIRVIERAVWPEDFASASEVFVTGTAAEVTPVCEIDDFRFDSREVTQVIIDAYDVLTGRGETPLESLEAAQ